MTSILTLALSLLVSLGAEVPLGTTALRAAALNQKLSAVASNGHDFLALWSDERTAAHSYQPALFAGRVDDAGRPLDPRGHKLADAATGSLIRDGNSYLVLYTLASGQSFLQKLDDDGNPAGTPTRMDLAVPPRSFATNGRNLLALQFSGQVWLLSLDGSVIWKELLVAPTDASDVALLPNGDYRFVTLGGSAVTLVTANGTTGFLTSRTLLTQVGRMGALARPDGRTLVAWTEGNVAKYEIVDGSGNVVVAPVELTVHADPDSAPSVGWDGRQFLIALASNGSLQASRVAADGRLVDPAPMDVAGPSSDVRFAASSSAVLTAWSAFGRTNDFDVVGRVSSDFDTFFGAPTNAIANSAPIQERPRLAAGSAPLAFWFEDASILVQTIGGTPRTMFRGNPPPPFGVARGSASYLVAYRTNDDLLVAERVAFDGTPLHDGFIIAEPVDSFFATRSDMTPAVAFDGTEFLVVWADILGDLFAVRVAQDGHAIGPRIALASLGFHSGFAVTPRVVWSGSHFVVAWADQLYSQSLISPAPPEPARVRSSA